ncbi:MAG: DUF1254 domain-containing protein [Candidatus Actinomarina sp.]|tara:strand:+ start:636 stop:1175 length:540 start_codon:yes stop_codon:yes gene_type:complete
MKNSFLKISIIAIATHLLLIFFGPYIVMNQLDRNIADAIANPFEGCEDTYDGIVGNLDQVCISRRSAARMPNYDFIYTMCRYDLSNGDLYVSMPVPEDERYWVVHVHNNNTNVAFKINNLEIDSERYELLVTNKENINSSLKTIRTTDKGTVFWRLLVNTAEEIDTLDNQRRTTVCEYR